MHLTFHTPIIEQQACTALGRMAEEYSRIQRKMYAAIAAGRSEEKSFKREFSAEHNITSRQFNTIALEVRGKIEAVRENLTGQIEALEARVKTLKGALTALRRQIRTGLDRKGRRIGKARMEKKKKSFHEKQRKQERLETRIGEFRERIAARVSGLCFGTKALFHEQFKPGVSHRKWRREWRASRNGQFLIIGAAEEDAGCQSCQASLEEDGTVTLRLRPFNAMLEPRAASGKAEEDMQRRKTVTVKASDYITIRGVRFTHGARYVLAAVVGNASVDNAKRVPLTFRFVRDEDGRWHVHLSLDVPAAASFDAKLGVAGVDFNQDHIAVTIVDRHGNFVASRRFALHLNGVPSLRAKDMIRCAARDVVAWAKQLDVPLVAEALDFQNKKKSMAALSAKRSRLLSSLHYSAWGRALQSRCLKDGVALRLVNPAYSSQIGRAKFASSHGLSVHHAAAMVIARRGMHLSERLPGSAVRIPDGRGAHVTLNPLVKMGHRHVWASWAKATRTVNAALAARVPGVKRTRSSAGSKRKMTLDDSLPDFLLVGAAGKPSLDPSGEVPGRRPDPPVAGRLCQPRITAPAL